MVNKTRWTREGRSSCPRHMKGTEAYHHAIAIASSSTSVHLPLVKTVCTKQLGDFDLPAPTSCPRNAAETSEIAPESRFTPRRCYQVSCRIKVSRFAYKLYQRLHTLTESTSPAPATTAAHAMPAATAPIRNDLQHEITRHLMSAAARLQTVPIGKRLVLKIREYLLTFEARCNSLRSWV